MSSKDGKDIQEANKLPLLERIFVSLDDLNVRTQGVSAKLDGVLALLEAPRKEQTWTESFALTVPAGTLPGNEESQEVHWPIDGRLTQIVLFFPAGPQGTTAVFFTKEGQQMFPPKEGASIALENISVPYEVNISVRRGDRIRFNGNNSDSVPHTIRAQLTGVQGT